jgi:predicted phage terminase large subunit-like protein
MGVMIKRDNIQRYECLPIRTTSHYVVQSWDTAVKANADSDYSSCVTVMIDDRKNYYVMGVLTGRFLYPDLKAHAISQSQTYRPDKIVIEETVLGRMLVKDLKAAGLPVVSVVREGDKPTRVSFQLDKFANGKVFFPRTAPWLPAFENEVFAFPNGRHDDQVDALIQALAYKRPISVFSDEALEGFDRLSTALWRRQQWGF